MKDWLLKIKRQKEKRAAELRAAIKGSDSADEVRSLGETLDALLEELKEVDERLAELEEGDGGSGDGEAGGEGETGAEGEASRGGIDPAASYAARSTVGSFRLGESRSGQGSDLFASAEYRQAFHQFVTRGTALPEEYALAVRSSLAAVRADAVTTTTDASAVIPTTLMEKIIAKMDTYGNIWAKVSKTNIQGGVEVPIMDIKPVATWIGEDKVSDQQKLEANEKVVFAYHGLECRISQTILSSIVSLAVFEDKFVELGTEAMVKAIEAAIVNGDGSGKFKGITKDDRIENVVTLSPEEFASWEAWQKKVVAKIPKAYRNGEWIMEQGTFDGYINGMVDANGQPIARVNYGLDGGETYRFGGKEVETTEPAILASFDDAATGDVVAIFGKLSDYCVNSNMQMEIVRWVDHNENKRKTKLMLVADGKVLDPHGFVLVKKGEAASQASAKASK